MSKRKKSLCKTASCGNPVEFGCNVCTTCLHRNLAEAAETGLPLKPIKDEGADGSPMVSPFGTSFTREMQCGEQFDIQTLGVTVLKRADDYKVSVLGCPAVWECGKTVNEALGKLVQSHPKLFSKAVEPRTFLECGGCGYPEIDCECPRDDDEVCAAFSKAVRKSKKIVNDGLECPSCSSFDKNVRFDIMVLVDKVAKMERCAHPWHKLRSMPTFGPDELRGVLITTWGEHGAHVDVFDDMRKRLRIAEAALKAVHLDAQVIKDRADALVERLNNTVR